MTGTHVRSCVVPGNCQDWSEYENRTQCAVDGGVVYISYTQIEKGKYHPILEFRGYILCCREWTDSPHRARKLGKDISIEIFGKRRDTNV